jgi:2-isopropylmalate synthase
MESEILEGLGSGNGPIDAAFSAIERIVGHRFELDDFQIKAITQGHEALGAAFIRLRYKGLLFSGSGLSTDIIGSSIRAYVNALNKIANEENFQNR